MTNPIESIHSTGSGENSRIRPPLRYSSVLIALAFALFAVTPASRAVDPPPGGGYPGENTALGEDALFSLTTGTENVALGYEALFSNTSGLNNTATGHDALAANIVGFNNTANGWHALKQTTGNQNTGVGCDALTNTTTGSNNVGMGFRAGVNLITGSNNIDIGNTGVFDESNAIRIGTTGTQTATFIAGIRGVAIAAGQPVGVSASGQLGIRASSARFKEAISSMNKSSEAILALRPVSFRYNKELDPKGVPQFGLVAEEVAKVNPDLVVADDQGKPFTVRYEEINVMLLNEFLKEHRTVQQQQKEIDTLKAELKEQRALIQKVNDKVEFNKPAPRVVTGD
jgi:trimeric autotransporter adhesin